MHRYDVLIVGAGLFGATAARELLDAGKRCLVLEKRAHIGGNIYTKRIEGIDVHCYGPHIFHTNDEAVWRYIERFARMNRFINCPVANYRGELYNLPFNMNTFYRLWGTVTPEQARAHIERDRCAAGIGTPVNLEEQAISLVGDTLYNKLIRGYTQKQWGRPCSQLPPDIIKRLPVRFTYDNNYYAARFQGVPEEGYTRLAERLLEGAEVLFNTDYLSDKEKYDALASRVLYTGQADAYFNCCYGALDYRSLRFETEILDCENSQGVAVMNYTDEDTPYTRVIEHKHFNFGTQAKTVITREYPMAYHPGDEPFYPINDQRNRALYGQYKRLAETEKRTMFGGRLGLYGYYDMDQTVALARQAAKELLT